MSAAGVLLLILKGLGWVLLAVLALLVLAMVLPVGVFVEYRQELTVKAKVLCFGFTVIPGKPKPEEDANSAKKKGKKKTSDAEREKEPQGSKTKQPSRAQRWIRSLTPEKIERLLEHITPPLQRILRGFHVSRIRVYWPIQCAEPDQTAIAYGRAMAACNALWPKAAEKLDLRAEKLQIVPDFTGELAEKRQISCQIMTQLYIILLSGLTLILKVQRDPLVRF